MPNVSSPLNSKVELTSKPILLYKIAEEQESDLLKLEFSDAKIKMSRNSSVLGHFNTPPITFTISSKLQALLSDVSMLSFTILLLIDRFRHIVIFATYRGKNSGKVNRV